MVSKHIAVTRSRDVKNVVLDMRGITETYDVVFLVIGGKIPADRAWLSAASPVLRSLLTNGMKETFQSEITIEDIDLYTWKCLIDLTYFEPVHIKGTNEAWKLLECAHRFQMEELETAVFQALISLIDETNCCEIIVRAEEIHLRAIKTKAIEVLSSKFYTICTTPRLGVLNLDTMESLVASNELTILSEVNVLDAVVQWLKVHGCICNR